MKKYIIKTKNELSDVLGRTDVNFNKHAFLIKDVYLISIYGECYFVDETWFNTL